MKKDFPVAVFLCLVVITVPAFALKLAGTEETLTHEPNSRPAAGIYDYDLDSQIVVWLDSRDEVNYVPQIYAALFNDPCRAEFLIDSNAVGASFVKTAGEKIVYKIYNDIAAKNMLRIVDIGDINNPVIEDVDVAGNDIEGIEIENDIVVFQDAGDYDLIPRRICAFDLSDPSRTLHIIKEFTGNDYSGSNISLDGGVLTYSGEDEDINYGWIYYLEQADIASLSDPVIKRYNLPIDEESWSYSLINRLDTSGDWLVAYGSYLGRNGIIAVHNYKNSDANNWDWKVLYEVGQYHYMTPRIDGQFAVWVDDNRSQQDFAQSQIPADSTILMGAVLFDNGRTAASILKTFSDPDSNLTSAVVCGNKVVSAVAYYDGSESGTGEFLRNFLYADTVIMECGDKGYSLADLTRDCKVDFADFAMFAERWFICTTPGDENCIEGEVYSAGSNLWRIEENITE